MEETTPECSSRNSENIAVVMEECQICFNQTPATMFHKMELCTHSFCQSCVRKVIETKARMGGLVTCPLCLQQVSEGDVICLCGRETMKQLHQNYQNLPEFGAIPPPVTTAIDPQFELYARTNHVRECPQCGAPIDKSTGGSNFVTCHCGHSFDWLRAKLLFPCSQIHFDGKGPRKFLGRICNTHTRGALAKLIAYRIIAGVLIGPLVIVVGAVAVLIVGSVVAGRGCFRCYRRWRWNRSRR
eukprot:c4298_g1_i1.p1 GENE.c4298_g1_i1~~c4298_g1_i1.p1  ORF type:complete len:249 (+),score=35.56 c4298_g1_i1:23-748(+)